MNAVTGTPSVTTLYARGVDAGTIDHITKNHAIEGFKTRGAYTNVLLREGLKAFKAKKKASKHANNPVKKTTKKPAKPVKKATKKTTKKSK